MRSLQLLHQETKYPVIVGITGASGSILACGVIDQLLLMNVPVIATISSAASMVWHEEMDESLGTALERWGDKGHFRHYPVGDLKAPIASGTYPIHAMVVVPCSMATLAAIAHGMSDNLLRRAADVCIKERRPLTLVPRETPLSAIHLETMASLARLGVTILPPDPPFYLKPRSLEEVVDFVTQRVLKSLGVTEALPEHMRYEGPANSTTAG